MKKVIFTILCVFIFCSNSFARQSFQFSFNINNIHRERIYHRHKHRTIIIDNRRQYNRIYIEHLRKHNHKDFRNDVIIIRK